MTQSRHGLSFLLSLCLLGLAVDTSIPRDEILEAPETGDLVDVEEGSHRQARWLGPDTDEALSPTSDDIDTEESADKRQLRAVGGESNRTQDEGVSDSTEDDYDSNKAVDEDGQEIHEDPQSGKDAQSDEVPGRNTISRGLQYYSTVAEFMLEVKFNAVKGCDAKCQAMEPPPENPCMAPVIIYPATWCDFISCTPRPPPPPPPCIFSARLTPGFHHPARFPPPPPPPPPPRPAQGPSYTCSFNCDPCAPPCSPKPPCNCLSRQYCPCRTLRRMGRPHCVYRGGKVTECCDPC